VQTYWSLHKEIEERLEGVVLSGTTGEVLRAPGVLSLGEREDEPLCEDDVISAIENALARLCEMRASEGENMGQVLSELLGELESHHLMLGKYAQNQVEVQKEKLEERIRLLTPEIGGAVQERLLIEVAILADKLDITEELDRLESHFLQFREILSTPGTEPCGRRLDFLCQEMLREVNTTGSKCQMVEITKLTIEMKTLLERVREQVQNLE